MAELLLYGIIGDADAGVDAATVCGAVRSTSGPLDVRINSAGGSVWDGLAIYEALAAYPSAVTVYVDGVAASMASGIAMAGREIIMADAALMMIHDPEIALQGNADTLRADADRLDKVKAQLVGIYARRTGLPQVKIAAMMRAETWMTADEARAAGFSTRTTPSLKMAACADFSTFNYRNVPDCLKGNSMSDPIAPPAPAPAIIPLAPMATVAEIRQIVAQARLPESVALDIAETPMNVADVRAAVIDRIAASAPVITNHRPQDQRFGNPAFHAQAMSDALYARMTGTAPAGAAAEVMNLTMTDMARELLEHAGVPGVRRMQPEQVFNLASFAPRNAGQMTTSDFPNLLQSAGQRFLLDMFAAAESPIKQVGRVRSANDFPALSVLKLSGGGVLGKVPEGAAITHGSFTEGKESYSLATFAKIFSISRQALINDDLGAFTDPARAMGRAAAETEAQTLAGLLMANSGAGASMGDGNALYHTAHGNIAASGGAPGVATLSAGRAKMRAQMDTDGVTPLSAAPRFILSGSAQETAIELALASITPAQIANVNPFSGKLTPLVDPRLTGTAWRLFADPAMLPVVEYAYLNGGGGPIMETRQGWEVLGSEFRVYLDFGAGLVDWRGTYLDPGA